VFIARQGTALSSSYPVSGRPIGSGGGRAGRAAGTSAASRLSQSLLSGPRRLPALVDLDSNIAENGCMKTTVDIPEAELKDAMRFTKAKTKREAVVKILEDFNRRRRMAELVKYAGTFSDSYPTNEEIEAVDERRDRRLGARSRR
jgi:Arc/MetJ family transcription regulator